MKRFLADRARGCVCPPELPVCVCGHEPEAELLTRRAVAPEPARWPRTRALAPPTCAPRSRLADRRRSALMAAAAPARKSPARAPAPRRTTRAPRRSRRASTGAGTARRRPAAT